MHNIISNLQIERVEMCIFTRELEQKLEQKLALTGHVIESKLFHRTVGENVISICSSGFNRSLAGTNGM